jgi:molybdate transport system substrate-binding protein
VSLRLRAGAAALALVAAGCGGESGDALRVAAAASLEPAFSRYLAAERGGRARLSLGGSDEVAAQVRAGARPDAIAVADARIAQRLFRDGRVERPLRFASNRVVLAAPAGGRVRSLADATEPGVSVAVGAPGVPVGDYARAGLRRLGGPVARALEANVRSQEPDVAGIVAKLARGAADAGFVYATDVRAARGRLREVALPPRARATAVYAAAVVRGARHPARAREFVRGLRAAQGRRALRAAGFEPVSR